MDADTTMALSVDADGDAYCLVATRVVASRRTGSGPWSFDSDGGGLLADHAGVS